MNKDVIMMIIFLSAVLAIAVVVITATTILIKKSKKRLESESQRKLDNLQNSNFPWSKESLKHKYLLSKYSNNSSILPSFSISSFICHHCLKTVMVSKIHLTCPYCEAQFGYRKTQGIKDEPVDSIISLVSIGIDEVGLRNAIFDSCPKCDGKIQFITCYHCGEPINLFAPYNESELEGKRYVR